MVSRRAPWWLLAGLLCVPATSALAHLGHDEDKKAVAKPELENGQADAAGAAEGGSEDEWNDAEDWGDVEEVQEVQDVQEVEAAKEDPKGLIAVVGFFHAAMVHMPIAWLALLVLLDILTFLRGVNFNKSGYLLLMISIASFVPAILSGLARLSGFEEPSDDALFHRNVMFAAVPLLLVALFLRYRSGNALKGTARHAYLGLILVGAALVFAGAHEGGEMVYGEAPF